MDSSTSADVRGRPPASTNRVIDRLDIAMQRAGVSGGQLAHAIGIKPQNLTNLRRKASAEGMRAVHLAHAADFLHCDLRWLCTGEGGDYVAASGPGELSLLAREVAEWLDQMSDDDRWKAYAMVSQMRRGNWPIFENVPPRSAR